MEEEKSCGLAVAHFEQSDTLAKEAHKLASSFASSFPKFHLDTRNNSSGPSASGFFSAAILNAAAAALHGGNAASAAILEVLKLNMQTCSEKLAAAIKDNDMVYHAKVPPKETLDGLEKLNAVKSSSFTELLQNTNADVAKMIGPDIFVKLVSKAVNASKNNPGEKVTVFRKDPDKLKKI